MTNKFYVTTPIYYVNDKPHIGHAYTTIAADVLSRYYRDKKYDVFFLTGTDEHGNKVAESAQKAGKTPKEFCDEISELFKKSWQNLDIKYDYFVRTTDKRHIKSVDKFMLKLKEAGAIYQSEYEGLYCTGCEKFITEKELVDGKCPEHNKVPEKITEKNYFFKLSDYLERVKKLIEDDTIKIRPQNAKNETLGLFKQDLQDFSISREKVKWGIPLVFDKKQNVYVWVEALQNYISSIGYEDNKKEFKKWWPDVLHLMAREIIKFHCIYWPAMLLAISEEPPKSIFVHGYFTIDGQKMSKSLGNSIDPNFLVEKYGSDATRYLLLCQFPFGQDGDIKEFLFKEKYNSDLANGLGNLVSRTLNMIEKYCSGKIPEALKNPKAKELEEVNDLIPELKFDEALKKIWQVIAWANKYIDEEQPWQLAKRNETKKLNKVISELSALICDLAKVLKPFMPKISEKITNSLICDKIIKGEPLYPRIN